MATGHQAAVAVTFGGKEYILPNHTVAIVSVEADGRGGAVLFNSSELVVPGERTVIGAFPCVNFTAI